MIHWVAFAIASALATTASISSAVQADQLPWGVGKWRFVRLQDGAGGKKNCFAKHANEGMILSESSLVITGVPRYAGFWSSEPQVSFDGQPPFTPKNLSGFNRDVHSLMLQEAALSKATSTKYISIMVGEVDSGKKDVTGIDGALRYVQSGCVGDVSQLR